MAPARGDSEIRVNIPLDTIDTTLSFFYFVTKKHFYSMKWHQIGTKFYIFISNDRLEKQVGKVA